MRTASSLDTDAMKALLLLNNDLPHANASLWVTADLHQWMAFLMESFSQRIAVSRDGSLMCDGS
eukprot:CAMPEP_0183723878 /NCGR_PEP_ID=MMETSP0737-20130205/16652_1 /TAXON_ID=385413 /ORGANISM="Thalassiosira miniscula, Strain CCMP1093" /LENGTH=63 /DNA_ID=CAMNT_0025954293 /DNA_START=81 /DNA_END=272 /DNA_ORIENTATION=-